jgi:hypothetical protein
MGVAPEVEVKMADENKETVPDRLRLLSAQVGGPAALAGLLGVHRTSLFGYLKGKPIPTARLHSIAAIYPCSLDWLLEGKGEAPKPTLSRTMKAQAASMSASTKLWKELAEADYKPHPGGTFQITSKTRETVLLAPTLEQLKLAIKPEKKDKFEEILGQDLTRLVIEGKACPSLEMLALLEPLLGPRLNWILGMEG